MAICCAVFLFLLKCFPSIRKWYVLHASFQTFKRRCHIDCIMKLFFSTELRGDRSKPLTAWSSFQKVLRKFLSWVYSLEDVFEELRQQFAGCAKKQTKKPRFDSVN